MEIIIGVIICIIPFIWLAQTYWLFKLLSQRKALRMETANLDDELTLSKLEAAEGEDYIRDKVNQADLTHWLDSIPRQKYANEIEVEAKFIYPLVKYLGYSDRDISLRRAVRLKMGREATTGEADWVIWTRSNPRKAFLIIEAKSPSQALDATVIEQARSYAFGLNAPFYIATNASQLLLYRRGVEEDSRIIACDSIKYSQVWSTLKDVIGADSHIEGMIPPQSATFDDIEPEDTDALIVSLVEKGKKIDAIKLYRLEAGVGLIDAKDYVESLVEGVNTDQSELHDDDEPEDTDAVIISLVEKGKKIEAIKLYRREAGVGLKEAKDYVESLIE